MLAKDDDDDLSPIEKLACLEQRFGKEREVIIEEAVASLIILWECCPSEAQERFRQRIAVDDPGVRGERGPS